MGVSDNLLHDASSNQETLIFCSQTLRSKAKETSYDALNNTPCLLPSWISKVSAKQVSQLCNVGDNTAHYNGITHGWIGTSDIDAWYTIETIAEKNNIGYKQISQDDERE
ncbi:hypothetical protein LOK49_LG07G01576 [Camellia lanceoleosa]|uniref:Uncharacterized protein n=1 Tax=Camellia lanceoleosa TaxID=1840588 RepID=A0ACC0H497_9ERIC|nr:hypothetical protein LOK49_LG07G01576 [Camellia lanceoleosa]